VAGAIFSSKDCVVGAFSLLERRLEISRFANDTPAASAGGAGCAPMQGRCVLGVTDLTPEGANAAWRAGLVARDRGVPLHLLCVQADARGIAGVEAAVRNLARQLQQRLHVVTSASCMAGSLRDHVAAFSERAGLLVLPWRRGNALIDAVLGTLPERIYRTLFIPMLVVRQPAFSSYRRVLVPVKLEGDAVSMITAARNVSRDPRMRVFHVLGTSHEESLRVADVSERALRLQRQHRSRAAYTMLNEFIARAGAHEGAAALVSFGHVPTRVLEIARANRAQLLVLGKARRSLLSELFFASLSKSLLSNAEADVLVLPVDEGTRAVHEGFQTWPAV
jgi:nucleotide-binding universal stress UspA family protein